MFYSSQADLSSLLNLLISECQIKRISLLKIQRVAGSYAEGFLEQSPNSKMMKLLHELAGGSQGYVRSETLRTFTEQEYRKIVVSLP